MLHRRHGTSNTSSHRLRLLNLIMILLVLATTIQFFTILPAFPFYISQPQEQSKDRQEGTPQEQQVEDRCHHHDNLVLLAKAIASAKNLLFQEEPPQIYRVFPTTRHHLQNHRTIHSNSKETGNWNNEYDWCVPGGTNVNNPMMMMMERNPHNRISVPANKTRISSPTQGQKNQTTTRFSSFLHVSSSPHQRRVDQQVTASSSPTPPVQGLLFAKTIKTASSTAAAVTMRLARRVSQRQQVARSPSSSSPSPSRNNGEKPRMTRVAIAGGDVCKHMVVHAHSYANHFANRDMDRSFLWTIVRHPQKRAISAYKYFQLGMLGQAPSIQALIAYLEAAKDQMLQQLRMDRPRVNQAMGILTIKNTERMTASDGGRDDDGGRPRPQQVHGEQRLKHQSHQMMGRVDQCIRDNPINVSKLIRDTVQGYNFIAISERLEESLVVLLVLLGLIDAHEGFNDEENAYDSAELHIIDRALSDLLVLPSKQAGGWEENLSPRENRYIQDGLPYLGLPSLLTSNVSISNTRCVTIPKYLPSEWWTGGKEYSNNNMDLDERTNPDNSVAAPSAERILLETYLEQNYTLDNLDYLLYDFANRKLDLTIDRVIGRRRLEQLVKRLRSLQNQAGQQCGDVAIFPCSSTGHRQSRSRSDCYAGDLGCGFRCIDQLFPISRHL